MTERLQEVLNAPGFSNLKVWQLSKGAQIQIYKALLFA